MLITEMGVLFGPFRCHILFNQQRREDPFEIHFVVRNVGKLAQSSGNQYLHILIVESDINLFRLGIVTVFGKGCGLLSILSSLGHELLEVPIGFPFRCGG